MIVCPASPDTSSGKISAIHLFHPTTNLDPLTSLSFRHQVCHILLFCASKGRSDHLPTLGTFHIQKLHLTGSMVYRKKEKPRAD